MTAAGGSGLAWRDGDIVTLAVTGLTGLIAIAAAWFAAAGTTTLTHQAAWLQLAVAGFAIFAGGNCLWLLRGRRAVGERRAALIALEPEHRETPAPAAAPMTSSLELVSAPGMARTHYRNCPLVDGKPVEPAGPADGEPCGVCCA